MKSSRNKRLTRIRLGLIALGCCALLACFSGCAQNKDPKPSEPDAMEAAVTEEQRETMRLMNKAAEAAYEGAQNGDLEEARTRIAQLSVLAAKLRYEGIATTEGMEALTGSIMDAMRALNSVSPNERNVQQKVAAARLAVDALSHREQPLWKEFRKSLEDDLTALEEAAKSGDDSASSRALALWRAHAERVGPAIVIGKGGAEAAMLKSMTAFLVNAVRTADWQGLLEAAPGVRAALRDVFSDEHRQTMANPLVPTAEPPNPALWSIGLGSFIVAVLTYVGWRKYTAEHVLPPYRGFRGRRR